MRIAEIAPIFFPVPPSTYGGSELIVSVLTEGLVARGHDIVLFASGDSKTSARLDACFATHTGVSAAAMRDELYHRAYAYLRAADVDVIHDHGWYGTAFAALHGGTPPVVQTLHFAWSERSRREHALIGDRVHRVAVSRAQADENTAVTYADVIHHGLPCDEFPLVREKDDYLIFVGRASPEKAPHVAVDVARAAGRTLVMLVKRAEPREREYWAKYVEPRLTGAEVIVEAPEPQVRIDLTSRAHALLFPIQWSEPFGLVQIEAMACGTPVIAMSRGAVPEVVVDGITGILCSNTEEMVAAVDDAEQISPDACRRHVETHFSADQLVERHERLFARITAG